MLVQIGQRAQTEDVVDLLAECHARIRRFLEMSRRLAERHEVSDDEVRSTASQIRRYFTSAFTHHIADEDDLISPLLAGSTPKIDEVLARMHDDHMRHADAIALLVGICADIERDPRKLEARRAELAHAQLAVRQHLEPHLESEERELFPALRALSAETKEAIRAGMRKRREADFAQ
jgi:hemerythrin-like domain-containing protein